MVTQRAVLVEHCHSSPFTSRMTSSVSMSQGRTGSERPIRHFRTAASFFRASARWRDRMSSQSRSAPSVCRAIPCSTSVSYACQSDMSGIDRKLLRPAPTDMHVSDAIKPKHCATLQTEYDAPHASFTPSPCSSCHVRSDTAYHLSAWPWTRCSTTRTPTLPVRSAWPRVCASA